MSIQATYFEATKRRKSPKPTKYVINANINTQDERVNDDINPQSKGNKSKLNKTKASSSASSIDFRLENSAESYWLNQVNPAEAPMVLESIRFWVNDFQGQDEIVIMAIDEMLKNGAKNYNYLDKVLKSWENKQLDTVEKVKNYLQGHYSKSPKNNQIRKEPIPKWLDDPEGYNKQKERGYEDVPF